VEVKAKVNAEVEPWLESVHLQASTADPLRISSIGMGHVERPLKASEVVQIHVQSLFLICEGEYI
jgi:hypothetical protein